MDTGSNAGASRVSEHVRYGCCCNLLCQCVSLPRVEGRCALFGIRCQHFHCCFQQSERHRQDLLCCLLHRRACMSAYHVTLQQAIGKFLRTSELQAKLTRTLHKLAYSPTCGFPAWRIIAFHCLRGAQRIHQQHLRLNRRQLQNQLVEGASRRFLQVPCTRRCHHGIEPQQQTQCVHIPRA